LTRKKPGKLVSSCGGGTREGAESFLLGISERGGGLENGTEGSTPMKKSFGLVKMEYPAREGA